MTKKPRYYCECGKTLPGIKDLNWGSWSCVECGMSFCQDCGYKLTQKNKCSNIANHRKEDGMRTIEELLKEKKLAEEKRKNDPYTVLDDVRKEINEMLYKMRLYNNLYSNIELMEILERWEKDLENVQDAENYENIL